MYYGDDVIEEVRVRNDIVDVVSQAVHLEKRGGNYFGLCPFHNEKTPSFSVSPSKQMFYCFGCGAGGNVFGFLQKYENISWREAVEQLADRAGVVLPKTQPSAKALLQKEQKERLFAINKEAATWYYHRLREEAGRTGLQYLEKRGLTSETMRRFGLGYAPVTRNGLCAYLREKGYTDAELVTAGVAVRDEKHGLRDKFWNRVMFPIQDVSGRVIGFGGRVLGDGEPKYLNSPETPVFDKSRNLYGLMHARHARKGHIILCEGYMDVIAMHQAGFTQAAASLGTAFTIGQANILKRYTEDVLLAYDSDEAGTRAALRAAGIAKEAGLRAKIIRLGPFKDPDELIRNEDASGMERRIREAENPFVFETEILQASFRMDDPDAVTAFHRAVAEKLAAGFPDAAERENYLQAACARYHIDVQIMKDLVARYALRNGGAGEHQALPRRTGNRSGRAERQKEGMLKSQRRLLTMLTEDARVYPAVRSFVSPDDFTDPLGRDVAREVFSRMRDGTFNAASMVDRFEDEAEKEAVIRMFHEDTDSEASDEMLEIELHEVIYNILRQSYEAQMKDADPSDASYLNLIREGKQRLEAFSHKRIRL